MIAEGYFRLSVCPDVLLLLTSDWIRRKRFTTFLLSACLLLSFPLSILTVVVEGKSCDQRLGDVDEFASVP